MGNCGASPHLVVHNHNSSITEINDNVDLKKYFSLPQIDNLKPKLIKTLRQDISIMIATKYKKTIGNIFNKLKDPTERLENPM